MSAQAGKLIADHSFTTRKLDELEDVMSQFVAAQRLAPMTRAGQLDGGFQIHGLQSLGVFDVRFGRKLYIDFPPDETDDRLNNFAFVMARRGSAQLLFGRDEFAISGNRSIFFSSGATRALQFSEDCDARALLLNRSRLSECCAKLLGRDLDRRIDLDIDLQLDTDAGQSWLRVVQYAANELSDPNSLIRSVPALCNQLEQLVFTRLLYGHTHNYSEALLQPQSGAVPFYVKRAEAFIEAHFAQPLSLADIAAHVGVSARSLQNGFRSFRGTTPMAFLRSVRLQKAHMELIVADPSLSTVTQIALACGFSHMGEFGAAYKRTFGVTPRETLARTI